MKTIGLSMLLALAPASALAEPQHADLELGGFAGARLFSDNTKLGREKASPDATGFKDAFLWGARFGYLPTPRLALEAELAFVPTETHDKTAELLSFNWRLNVLYALTDGAYKPYVELGGGAQTVSSTNTAVVASDTDPAFHAGLGLKIEPWKDWGLRVGGRPVWQQSRDGSISTELELAAGVYGRFGRPVPPPVVAPPPPADTDGDGVTDDKDRCPKEAEDKDGFQDDDGCPDPDNDGDGFLDAVDRCPGEAGPDAGCPDKDEDGDGVVSRLDRCPAQNGPKDNGGCPDQDRDGDGLVDRLDKCPDQAETRNGFEDADGCPDQLPEDLAKAVGRVEGIVFDAGKASIKVKKSKASLDRIAEVMKKHPGVIVEVSGHTDDKGDHDKNVKLSQERAEAVKAALVERGVSADGLRPKGYGPDKPVGPNKSAKDRAKNRRVEFTLVTEAR